MQDLDKTAQDVIDDTIQDSDSIVDDIENSDAAVDYEQENDSNEQQDSTNVDALRQRLEATEKQLEYFKEMMRQNQDIVELLKNRQQPNEVKDVLADLDPDEPLTARHIGLLEEKIKRENEKRIQELDEQYKRSIVVLSEKAARQKYPDYDEVIKLAADMARQDPLILQKIASSSDPAEEAYQWGMRHPMYIDKLKSKTQKDVINKVRTNMSKQSPNAQSRVAPLKKDIFEMTPEEFAEYRRKKVGI